MIRPLPFSSISECSASNRNGGMPMVSSIHKHQERWDLQHQLCAWSLNPEPANMGAPRGQWNSRIRTFLGLFQRSKRPNRD